MNPGKCVLQLFSLLLIACPSSAREEIFHVTGLPSTHSMRAEVAGVDQPVILDLSGGDWAYPIFNRSTDGGASWTPLKISFPGHFQSITAAQIDPPVFFVLTDQALFRLDGVSLERVRIGPAGIRITIDPNNPERLILETNDYCLESPDSGRTWNRFRIGGNDIGRVYFVKGHPEFAFYYDRALEMHCVIGNGGGIRHIRLPDRVDWFGCVDVLPDLTILGSDDNALWMFEYNGTTWIKVHTFTSGISNLTHMSNANSTVLAGLSGQGLWKSDNKGVLWQLIRDDISVYLIHFSTIGTFVSSGEGLWISRNDLQTFELLEGRIAFKRWTSLLFDSRPPHDMYVCGAEIAKSTDSGETWIPQTDFPENGFGQIRQSFYDPTIWYMQGSGLYYSDSDRADWQNIGWSYDDKYWPEFVGISETGRGVFVASGSYYTQDGPEYYTNFNQYIPEEMEWERYHPQFFGQLHLHRGDATPVLPYIFNCCYNQLHISTDGGIGFSGSPHDAPTMQTLIPLRNDIEHFMFVNNERLHRFNIETGAIDPLETIAAEDICTFTFDDYLIAADRLFRADSSHIEPIPVDGVSPAVYRIYSHPLDPTLIYALLNSGGVMIGRVDPNSSPPAPPSAVHSEWISDHEIELSWIGAPGAKGIRVYETVDGYSETTIRTVDEPLQSVRIDVRTAAMTALSASYRLSSFDVYGKEGTVSEPLVVPIGRRAPLIRMTGCWDTRIQSDTGGEAVIVALIQDRQGLDTIARVELLVNGVTTGLELKDDGHHHDSGEGDGIFGVVIPVASPVSKSRFMVEVEAIDVDGHSARASASVPFFTGASR